MDQDGSGTVSGALGRSVSWEELGRAGLSGTAGQYGTAKPGWGSEGSSCAVAVTLDTLVTGGCALEKAVFSGC